MFLLCERAVADAFHVTVLSPHMHVSSGRKLFIFSKEFLHQVHTVYANGLEVSSIHFVQRAINLAVI